MTKLTWFLAKFSILRPKRYYFTILGLKISFFEDLRFSIKPSWKHKVILSMLERSKKMTKKFVFLRKSISLPGGIFSCVWGAAKTVRHTEKIKCGFHAWIPRSVFQRVESTCWIHAWIPHFLVRKLNQILNKKCGIHTWNTRMESTCWIHAWDSHVDSTL